MIEFIGVFTRAFIVFSIAAFLSSTIVLRKNDSNIGGMDGNEREQSFYFESGPGLYATPPPPLKVFDLEVSIDGLIIRADQDIEIKVEISNVTKLRKGEARVSISAPSFTVSPESARVLELSNGRSTFFILKANSVGDKKIRVFGEFSYEEQEENDLFGHFEPKIVDGEVQMVPTRFTVIRSPQFEEIFDVKVNEVLKPFGFGLQVVDLIQKLSAILGVPALIVLYFTSRAKKKGEKDKSRIILPR